MQYHTTLEDAGYMTLALSSWNLHSLARIFGVSRRDTWLGSRPLFGITAVIMSHNRMTKCVFETASK